MTPQWGISSCHSKQGRIISVRHRRSSWMPTRRQTSGVVHLDVARPNAYIFYWAQRRAREKQRLRLAETRNGLVTDCHRINELGYSPRFATWKTKNRQPGWAKSTQVAHQVGPMLSSDLATGQSILDLIANDLAKVLADLKKVFIKGS